MALVNALAEHPHRYATIGGLIFPLTEPDALLNLKLVRTPAEHPYEQP